MKCINCLRETEGEYCGDCVYVDITDNALSPRKRKFRICLRCNKKFLSYNPSNRICCRCKYWINEVDTEFDFIT
jgi:hypothetical protein